MAAQNGSCVACTPILNCVPGKTLSHGWTNGWSSRGGSETGSCVCTECVTGWVGDLCNVPDSVDGDTCKHVGSGEFQERVSIAGVLRPGTGNGDVFRCGAGELLPGNPTGWWGHCIPAATRSLHHSHNIIITGVDHSATSPPIPT